MYFSSVACVLASGRLAVAGPSAAEQARAEALFDEGKRLMAETRWAEACPKLEESMRIEEAGGTLAALALCHQGQGKTATAWAEFKALLALANRTGHAERKALAEESLKALEQVLVWVRIELPPERGALPGLTVRLDGNVLGKGSWGVSLPVDPGSHEIEAEAPGYRPWRTLLTLGPSAERRGVTIPALEPLPVAPPAAASAPPASAAAPPARPPRARSRTPSLIAGGAGVVSLLVGGYFGVRALSKMSEANRACAGVECSDDRAIEASHDANRSAWVSNVGLGVGLAGLLTSYLLWPSSSDTAAAGRKIRVAGPAVPAASAAAPPARARSRTPSLIAGGAGVVSLLVGGYFGVRALSKMSEANRACAGAGCSDDRAIEASHDANRSAWVSNVGLGVGLAGLLTSYLLWPSSSDTAAAGRETRVAGLLERDGGGLVVSGRF